MRVVITGATSFLGRKYVDISLKKGWDVYAIVRPNSTKMEELIGLPLHIIELDMKDYSKIASYTKDIDCLIHFAWDGTRGALRNSAELQFNNYYFSMQMMRAIADKGCKRIITVGSQAEYGITTGCVEENYVCKPNTQYGIYKYKLFEETFQLCVKKGIQYKAPRIFSVYGPNDNEETLVMSCINKMVVGKPCYLTMCNQEWDYLFVDDAVEALIALTERECMDGVYNLGSGDCRLLKEYVYEMKAILNSKSEIVFGAVSYPSSGIVNVHPSIERIAREVNWRANTSFKEGIGKILKNNEVLV